ncbi:hypothetical protein INT45_006050, partial [Circinella minor]
MDLIKVSRKHGLSKVFSRAFRDALFVVDEDDKNKVKNVLEKQGTTWEKKLSENPDWVLRRVRRTYVNVYNYYEGVIPPPSILYPVVKDLSKHMGHYGVQELGGIHQNIIRRFGSFGASVELTDSALADYRLRHNIN